MHVVKASVCDDSPRKKLGMQEESLKWNCKEEVFTKICKHEREPMSKWMRCVFILDKNQVSLCKWIKKFIWKKILNVYIAKWKLVTIPEANMSVYAHSSSHQVDCLKFFALKKSRTLQLEAKLINFLH